MTHSIGYPDPVLPGWRITSWKFLSQNAFLQPYGYISGFNATLLVEPLLGRPEVPLEVVWLNATQKYMSIWQSSNTGCHLCWQLICNFIPKRHKAECFWLTKLELLISINQCINILLHYAIWQHHVVLLSTTSVATDGFRHCRHAISVNARIYCKFSDTYGNLYCIRFAIDPSGRNRSKVWRNTAPRTQLYVHKPYWSQFRPRCKMVCCSSWLDQV